MSIKEEMVGNSKSETSLKKLEPFNLRPQRTMKIYTISKKYVIAKYKKWPRTGTRA